VEKRIEVELTLIRQAFPNVVYQNAGHWVCLPSYPLPEGWNRVATDIAFQIGDGFPAAPPYGFYVPSGIQYRGNIPSSYTEPAASGPPFEGSWGFFSWAPTMWKPAADAHKGSNLLQWAKGFADRFQEGA